MVWQPIETITHSANSKSGLQFWFMHCKIVEVLKNSCIVWKFHVWEQPAPVLLSVCSLAKSEDKNLHFVFTFGSLFVIHQLSILIDSLPCSSYDFWVFFHGFVIAVSTWIITIWWRAVQIVLALSLMHRVVIKTTMLSATIAQSSFSYWLLLCTWWTPKTTMTVFADFVKSLTWPWWSKVLLLHPCFGLLLCMLLGVLTGCRTCTFICLYFFITQLLLSRLINHCAYSNFSISLQVYKS